MVDFANTPLKAWNRTSSDEFRVVASKTSGPQTSLIGKVLYNLKAFFGMEPGMLRDLKSENIASVERFKNDINRFFDRRADHQAGKASAYGQIHKLATKQLDYLETGGRRLSDRSIKQVMTHVSTLTDAVDEANQKLEDRFSPYVRNEAMQQIDMREILKDAGALDENDHMKRVLTDQEKKNIKEGVAAELEKLCHAVKQNLIQSNNTVWNGATSPKGLNELIGYAQMAPISSFRLFGTEAKDQTFSREVEREVNLVKKGFESKWDQEPLDEKALKKELYSKMLGLAKKWGSGIPPSDDSPLALENAKFGHSHPELNLFITSALAKELQNASPKDTETNKPLLEWEDEKAEWDHTLRDAKFALFLAGRQIDRANLSEPEKKEARQVLGDLVKLGNQCLDDNRIFGDKNADDFRGSQSEYSNLLQRHAKAENFLESANKFHPQTPELNALRNTLIAMATRAVKGLKASLDACETVIKKKHDIDVKTYGEDIVNLIKSNPERLDRAKDTPIVFEPSMVPKFIDSLGKGTRQQPGDPKTASVCRNAWNLISRQESDPTLGQEALKQRDAINNFANMDTNRLIEVTKAHETVVEQIHNQLSEVRERQKSLPSEAPRILRDSLTAFANALEQRREVAAGPREAARKELDSRRNKASENASVFEKRFGKPLTDLLKSQIGEAFEGIPKVGREHVESVATRARETPGFAGVQKDSPGLIDRLVSHIGNAEQTDSLTGTTSDDLKVMTDSELDSVLDRSSRLSANLENDLSSIDEALKMLATPSGKGAVAKDQADNVLVSFLVAARAALTMQRDALGPVQQAASELAAGRGALSFAKLMPNLHKATSGTPRPPATSSTSPSHVARSIGNTVKQSSSRHGQTLSRAVSLGYRIRNAFTTAKQNREAWYKETGSERSTQVLHESDEFQSFSEMVKTGEAEWKEACRQLESILNETKPTLGLVGRDSLTYNLASAILQDLQSIDFETMRSFVSETLSSLARI
jgi:hypothetical protein